MLEDEHISRTKQQVLKQQIPVALDEIYCISQELKSLMILLRVTHTHTLSLMSWSV